MSTHVGDAGPAAHWDAVIDSVLRGHTSAFGAVVREYALPLRSYLAGQVYHLDEVDDLAQDVFLAALENLASFRRGEDFWAWLRGIARHKLLNHFRRTARRDQATLRLRQKVLEVVADDLFAAVERAETIRRLLYCVANLPERLRRVVRAGMDSVKADRLAAELDTTVGVIYNMHHRANQLLRVCLEAGGGKD